MRHHDRRQRGVGTILVQVAYFLTSQAAPVYVVATPSMAQLTCRAGAATTSGICSRTTNAAIIAASRVAARRAWMPLTSASPAAKWPTPVAQAQNVWLGGIHAGTMPAVGAIQLKCASPNTRQHTPARMRVVVMSVPRNAPARLA